MISWILYQIWDCSSTCSPVQFSAPESRYRLLKSFAPGCVRCFVIISVHSMTLHGRYIRYITYIINNCFNVSHVWNRMSKYLYAALSEMIQRWKFHRYMRILNIPRAEFSLVSKFCVNLPRWKIFLILNCFPIYSSSSLSFRTNRTILLIISWNRRE